jgi:hypothetical protein
VKYLFLSLALSVLMLITGQAQSATVQNMYSVRLNVETREREERTETIKSAMETVLVRMTGDGGIAQNPEVTDVIRGASGFVQRFQYFPAEEGYELQIDFDEVRLSKNIANRGLPVWGRERPSVLAWIAVSKGGSRYLVGAKQPKEAREALRDQAELRGIPLSFPLLDLEDRNAVKSGDVVGGFYDTIEAASERYASDSLLVGYVRQSQGSWRARWRLTEGEQSVVFESEGAKLEDALNQGVDMLASNLAAWHATQGFTDQNERLFVTVHDVQTLGEYFRVRDYLDGLDVVSQVMPDKVHLPEIRLRISMRGQSRNLERLIMLSNVLQPYQAMEDPQMTPGLAELQYRLVR